MHAKQIIVTDQDIFQTTDVKFVYIILPKSIKARLVKLCTHAIYPKGFKQRKIWLLLRLYWWLFWWIFQYIHIELGRGTALRLEFRGPFLNGGKHTWLLS